MRPSGVFDDANDEKALQEFRVPDVFVCLNLNYIFITVFFYAIYSTIAQLLSRKTTLNFKLVSLGKFYPFACYRIILIFKFIWPFSSNSAQKVHLCLFHCSISTVISSEKYYTDSKTNFHLRLWETQLKIEDRRYVIFYPDSVSTFVLCDYFDDNHNLMKFLGNPYKYALDSN